MESDTAILEESAQLCTSKACLLSSAEDQIGKAIDRLKAGKVPSLDDVPKHYYTHTVLTVVFNNMMQRTCIHHFLFNGYIKPILKKGTRDDPAKYPTWDKHLIQNWFDDIIAQRVESTFSSQQSKL